MKYIIKSTSISKITLSTDNTSISIDMTIFYGIDGDDRMSPSSVGCSIVLSLESGERSTLVSELNEGVEKWFSENFNQN